ncbi:hypothetical protein [Sphingopyxis sp.]|uniref:hypothetical protein n=1 Tax=Sphingopyxis sp. TaxID=1908224 RepID=UPI0025F5DD3B|nr:hypothetical protein [Sphingopyxis sp.]MBK6413766.1 hypothetical protein [Sphingopyxis sp.]
MKKALRATATPFFCFQRHCEERSDAAIQSGINRAGFLCLARNDDGSNMHRNFTLDRSTLLRL